MGRRIMTTQADIEAVLKEILEGVSKNKFTNGRIKIDRDIEATDDVATLYYDEKAWMKQEQLIRRIDTEVAWHAFCHRSEDDPHKFYVDDIVVYPQMVAGSTVETDQKEYEKFLNEFDIDKFNSIRAQCHSHVNFSTTPSTTDINFYQSIVNQLGADGYYIFSIWNKKGEKTIMIYDMENNVYYDTRNKDIDLIILYPAEDSILGFVEDAKTKLKKQTYATPKTYSGYTGGGFSNDVYTGYSGGHGGLYSGSSYTSKPLLPVKTNQPGDIGKK